MAVRRQYPDAAAPAIIDAIHRRGGRGGRVRHRGRRRHQQHAGQLRRPGRTARWRPSCSTRSSDSTLPIPSGRCRTARREIDDSWRRPTSSGRAWPRTRRIRWRRSCFAPFGRTSTRDPFAPVQRAPGRVGRGSRIHSDGRRTVARAARGPGRVGSGTGRRRRSARCSTSTSAGFSTRGCSPCTACRCRRPTWRDCRARGTTLVTCPRSNVAHRRGRAADRGVLRVRRPRGHRHRQPGERSGLERVRRTGDAARAGAVGAALRRCSTAPRVRARGRSGSTPTSGRSSRASARACSPSTLPPRTDDVEEYLVSGIQPESDSLDRRWMFATPPRLPLVRALQPFGVRAAVRVGGRAAGRAPRRRHVASRSAGFSRPWCRRAARRWGSTGWWTRGSTR